MRQPFALACLWLLPVVSLAPGACTEIPDFDRGASLTSSRQYPTIEPFGQVVAIGGDPAIDPADAAALQARAEALRRRAGSDVSEPLDPRLYEKAQGG